MGFLRIFETKDAKYYLGLGRHDRSSAILFRNVDFYDIDILVLEEPLDDDKNSLAYMVNHVQIAELYSMAKRRNPKINVYGVDIVPYPREIQNALFEEMVIVNGGISLAGLGVIGYSGVKICKNLDRRAFLKGAIGIASGLFLTSPVVSYTIESMMEDQAEPISDFFVNATRELFNLRTNTIPTPLISFRDAVVAKKISEYLVPKNKKEGKKVNVAIIYGSWHSGIETKLCNPWISDATIYYFDSIREFARKDVLNGVREIIGTRYGPQMLYHNCKLF